MKQGRVEHLARLETGGTMPLLIQKAGGLDHLGSLQGPCC